MAELLRISIIGAMPNGEEWSVNPVFSVGGDFGVPVTQIQAQTIATAIAAISAGNDLRGLMSTSTNINAIRVEARAVNGTLEAQAEASMVTPQAGMGGTNAHPFQTAMVFSLRTATPGATGRGRMYWPATGATLSVSTLRPSSAYVLTALTAMETYLSAIEAAIEVTLTGVALAVWSRKMEALRVVTQLQAGDVLDVQRRRRDALIENYQTVAYTA
jgi:hypothetical protein